MDELTSRQHEQATAKRRCVSQVTVRGTNFGHQTARGGSNLRTAPISFKLTELVTILILAAVFVQYRLEGQDAEPLVLILAGQSNMMGQASTSELAADEP